MSDHNFTMTLSARPAAAVTRSRVRRFLDGADTSSAACGNRSRHEAESPAAHTISGVTDEMA